MANTHIMVLVSLLLLPSAFHSVASDFHEHTEVAVKVLHEKSNAFHSGAFDFHKHTEVTVKVLHEKSNVIEGMVYCQSCKHLETSYLSGAEPIPFARVSVTCTNHRNVVFYYKEYTANENGYLFAKLEDYSSGHYLFDHILKACNVKLVSSPVDSCNVPTNVNNGITGTTLRLEHKRSTKKDCNYKFYTAGSLAFRPAQCTYNETNY